MQVVNRGMPQIPIPLAMRDDTVFMAKKANEKVSSVIAAYENQLRMQAQRRAQARARELSRHIQKARAGIIALEVKNNRVLGHMEDINRMEQGEVTPSPATHVISTVLEQA